MSITRGVRLACERFDGDAELQTHAVHVVTGHGRERIHWRDATRVAAVRVRPVTPATVAVARRNRDVAVNATRLA
jgi:hypothetical protein